MSILELSLAILCLENAYKYVDNQNHVFIDDQIMCLCKSNETPRAKQELKE